MRGQRGVRGQRRRRSLGRRHSAQKAPSGRTLLKEPLQRNLGFVRLGFDGGSDLVLRGEAVHLRSGQATVWQLVGGLAAPASHHFVLKVRCRDFQRRRSLAEDLVRVLKLRTRFESAAAPAPGWDAYAAMRTLPADARRRWTQRARPWLAMAAGTAKVGS